MTFLDIYGASVDLRTVTRLYVDRRVRKHGAGEWCVFAETDRHETKIMAQFGHQARDQQSAVSHLKTITGPWKLARRSLGEGGLARTFKPKPDPS